MPSGIVSFSASSKAVHYVVSALLFSLFVTCAQAQEDSQRVDSAAQVADDRSTLQFCLDFIEVPTHKAKPIVDGWMLFGRVESIASNANTRHSLKSLVVPASFTKQSEQWEFRSSEVLSVEQVSKLKSLGKVKASPKLVGACGSELSTQIGREVPFTTSYIPREKSDDSATSSLQPVISNVRDGISVAMVCNLDQRNESVDLHVSLELSQIKGVEPFTLETSQGPIQVQQPIVRTTSATNTCRVPVNQTVALCGGPLIQKSAVQRRLPLIGQVNSTATQSHIMIVLIRCETLLNAESAD